MKRTATKQSSRGLTLFELVIVLAILAAVTASAAVATDRVLSRRRVEVTQRMLQAFRDSVLGDFGQAEPLPAVSADSGRGALDGFVADMGRLPLAVGADPQWQLAELWSNPRGLAPYGRKTAPGDPEVFLYCGWRGPYLDLPVGASGLRDGWGRPLLVLTRDDDGMPLPATEGSPISGLTSTGSDGHLGVVSHDLPLPEDLAVWLGDVASSPTHADLTFTVLQYDENQEEVIPAGFGHVLVRLYLPDAATGNVGYLQSSIASGPFTAPPTFQFVDVPIGPKAVRAYWLGEGFSRLTSHPLSIEVHRGGQTSWRLLLPADSPEIP